MQRRLKRNDDARFSGVALCLEGWFSMPPANKPIVEDYDWGNVEIEKDGRFYLNTIYKDSLKEALEGLHLAMQKIWDYKPIIHSAYLKLRDTYNFPYEYALPKWFLHPSSLFFSIINALLSVAQKKHIGDFSQGELFGGCWRFYDWLLERDYFFNDKDQNGCVCENCFRTSCLDCEETYHY